ncbi:nitrate reductase [Verminephrobacter eiseniae]|uniref:nitrate reductase n=1 Tax=Verminephrobacter eiseniae TaxID=364317 RepID=UPI0022384E4B|nr:nitrate reductase [Verminephrobacter eiseniae]MCW5232370.1 nitrate reductase [Verminephrobacter eiseniae]MCW5296066.1 nitrate reductase [Verminephrobacter eiseniae]MCW8185248.1 nitrate reductase [Verminephrobacter eiseniae]MCW8224993.1 nitrate reductase [Verminephrobacter eiseniae]MCW8235008.1 nitrate reductase [Verminephrobacter eiseniae]
MQETRSTCPYCGVGCGVIIDSDGAQITAVRGDPAHPANFGRLCTKGMTLHLTASSPITRQTRLLQPMHRAHRADAPQPLSWDAALDLAAGKIADSIEKHGPEAIAFYVSGQLLTEDYYVFNKLAKGLIGSNHIDSNSRLCMSSAVAGYKATLGADAPPCCYDDLQHAQCLFIAGSNTAWAHPIVFRRIEAARAANPGMKIIVADPRRTDTAGMADLFLPLQPGSDVMLFNGMLHLMLREGWVDSAYIDAHTTGFAELKTLVRHCTPERVAQVCGISQADLATAARWFATGAHSDPAQRGATLSLYCQGLNQSSSGTAKNAALINLHLATGQIGKPGAGPFSLTGQPNAMGGREVGAMANLLSAHRDLGSPQHRAEVAALWGLPSVPDKPGKSAVEMFQAAADGEIKVLWIACTNPAQSMPDQTTVRRALQRAEFVLVQEAFAGAATCAYADLLLPATTWGEKTGTVTNSERRISRVRAAVPAPGQARHDWAIAVQLAHRLEARLRPGAATLFPYDTGHPEHGAQTIWNEHRASTRGRDLDITGLSWPLLDAAGPQQWPLPEGRTTGAARLYEDGIYPTADGRARFAAHAWQPTAEQRQARYPLSLSTGRLRDQWHGMTRTGTLGRLFGHAAEPGVQLHPQDMQRRNLRNGDLVQVSSQRGAIIVPVQADATLGLAQAFIAMHWGSEFLSGRSASGEPLAGVNALTPSAFCPASRQPELKHTAVQVLKADLPWTLLAMAWLPADSAQTTRQALSALLPQFSFASCVPFANDTALATPEHERTGVLMRAAAPAAPPDALIEHIAALLGLAGTDTLRYIDKKRSQRRYARLLRHGDSSTLQALVLAGDTSAQGWLQTLLQEQLPAHGYGRLLLQPGAQAPLALPARGKPVCSCQNVTDTAISATLAHCHGSASERLAQLQSQLRCGTHCGSCLPELKRMVQAAGAREPKPVAQAAM